MTEPRLPAPFGIPVDHLEVTRTEGWGGHWGATIRYLESHAPCIYLPTHDWRHACVAPRLSGGVIAVGTVSGDALHLEQASRLGAFWDAAVALDLTAAGDLQRRAPELFDRSRLIRPGLDVPDEVVKRRLDASRALSILTLESEPRGLARLGGLAGLEEALGRLSVPYELTVVRDHPEHPGTLARFRAERRPEGVREYLELSHIDLLDLLASVDVIVSAPPERMLPDDLRVAMGRGAIPVACGPSPSGLLEDGGNALLVPDGPDSQGWGRAVASRLAALHADADARAHLSAAAHATVARMLGVADMAEAYAELFDELIGERATGAYRRPRGEILPPPAEVEGIGIFPVELTYHAKGVGRFPARSDYRRFKGQLGALQPLRSLLLRAWS